MCTGDTTTKSSGSTGCLEVREEDWHKKSCQDTSQTKVLLKPLGCTAAFLP